MTSPLVLPVILSGGSGTRLWPLSSEGRPKQFIALAGSDTMLQLTVDRVADPDRFRPPMIVASPKHAELIEAQLADRAPPTALILEPHARNTAPAIALAALAASPDDLLLVMPSDHLIGDPRAFREAVAKAVRHSAEGWLVTFGVKPSRPETAYGYIRRGAELGPGIFAGGAFVEKPDRETATAYLAAGNYDWNAGIFLFRAGTFIDALAAHAPEILSAAEVAMDGATRDGRRIYPDGESFARSPSISVDYAVMEKADRFAVVPFDIRWSDVGSWDALHEVSGHDGSGNAALGDVLSIDTSGCLLRSEGPKIVAVGVKDLIVVALPDAVLVLPREQSQRVKEVVEALRSERGQD